MGRKGRKRQGRSSDAAPASPPKSEITRIGEPLTRRHPPPKSRRIPLVALSVSPFLPLQLTDALQSPALVHGNAMSAGPLPLCP
jgi:hypothetical protein